MPTDEAEFDRGQIEDLDDPAFLAWLEWMAHASNHRTIIVMANAFIAGYRKGQADADR